MFALRGYLWSYPFSQNSNICYITTSQVINCVDKYRQNYHIGFTLSTQVIYHIYFTWRKSFDSKVSQKKTQYMSWKVCLTFQANYEKKNTWQNINCTYISVFLSFCHYFVVLFLCCLWISLGEFPDLAYNNILHYGLVSSYKIMWGKLNALQDLHNKEYIGRIRVNQHLHWIECN